MCKCKYFPFTYIHIFINSFIFELHWCHFSFAMTFKNILCCMLLTQPVRFWLAENIYHFHFWIISSMAQRYYLAFFKKSIWMYFLISSGDIVSAEKPAFNCIVNAIQWYALLFFCCCFQALFWLKLCLCVLMFILLGVHWASQNYKLIFFTKFVNYFIFFLLIFSANKITCILSGYILFTGICGTLDFYSFFLFFKVLCIFIYFASRYSVILSLPLNSLVKFSVI